MNPTFKAVGCAGTPRSGDSGGFAVPLGTPPLYVPGVGGATVPNETDQPAQQIPLAYTFELNKMGFFTVLKGTIGPADVLILPQPVTVRQYFEILNVDTAATLYLQFGNPASAANGKPYSPGGGGQIWDTIVPQDDIHIFTTAASCAYVITFSNGPMFPY